MEINILKFIVDIYDSFTYHKRRKGVRVIPNIKPVSDLRNYGEVLRDYLQLLPGRELEEDEME